MLSESEPMNCDPADMAGEINRLNQKNSELEAHCREVEAERDRLRLPLRAQATVETVIKQAVEDFRRRAVEAVRTHKQSHKTSANQDYEYGYYDALDRSRELIESLPVGSSEVDL